MDLFIWLHFRFLHKLLIVGSFARVTLSLTDHVAGHVYHGPPQAITLT